MAERLVFGRMKFEVNGQTWKMELRRDGLHAKRLHYREDYLLDPAVLVRLSQKQPELFVIRELEEEPEPNQEVAV